MKNKTIGMLQPGYLPWLGFFEQLHRVDMFVILDDVQYTKGSWRNRHKIRTRPGWQWLTVPIYHNGRTGQLIKDVEIDNTKNWKKKHWNCLRENYCHSQYWSMYSSRIEEIYKKKWQYLIDLDMEFICFFVNSLGINTEIILSSSLGLDEKYKVIFGTTGDVNDRNIFYIKQLDGDVFYEGALGKTFLNVDRFVESNIELIFQNYNHPMYKQVYDPFIPYLSIVDLLFNEGPSSLDIINNSLQD